MTIAFEAHRWSPEDPGKAESLKMKTYCITATNPLAVVA
jgi:hypothetical protein